MNIDKKRTKKFLKTSAKLFLEDNSWKGENLEELFKEIFSDLPEGDVKQCLTKNYEKYKDKFLSFFPSTSLGIELAEEEPSVTDDPHILTQASGDTSTDEPPGGGSVTESTEGKSSGKKKKKKKLKKKTPLSVPAVEIHDWKGFINSMMEFLSKVQSEAANVFKNATTKSERTIKVAEEIWDFIIVCHFRQQNLQCVSDVSPSYEDIIATLMSLYVDLVTVWTRCSEVKKKSIGKSICMKVCYIVNKPKHLDVILASEQMQSCDRKLLLPFIRHCLLEAEPSSSHDNYLKYMLAIHKVWNIFGEKTSDLYQTALTIPATKKFMAWLADQSPKAVERMPNDNKFKRLQVTHFLLKEMTKELFQDLMDVLVGLSDPDNTQEQMEEAEDVNEDSSENSGLKKKKKKVKKNVDSSGVKTNKTREGICSSDNEDKNVKKNMKRKMDNSEDEEGQIVKKKKKGKSKIESEINNGDGRVKVNKKKKRLKQGDENINEGEGAEKTVEKRNQNIFFIDKGNKSKSDQDVFFIDKGSNAKTGFQNDNDAVEETQIGDVEEEHEENSGDMKMAEDSEEMDVGKDDDNSDEDVLILDEDQLCKSLSSDITSDKVNDIIPKQSRNIINMVPESDDDDDEITLRDENSQNFTSLKKRQSKESEEELGNNFVDHRKTTLAADDFDDNSSDNETGDVSMVTDSDFESDTVTSLPNIMKHKKFQFKSPFKVSLENDGENEMSPVVELSSDYKPRNGRSESDLNGEKQSQKTQLSGTIVSTPKSSKSSIGIRSGRKSSEGGSDSKCSRLSSSEESTPRSKISVKGGAEDEIKNMTSPNIIRYPNSVSVHPMIDDTCVSEEFSSPGDAESPKKGQNGTTVLVENIRNIDTNDIYEFKDSEDDGENDLEGKNSVRKSDRSKETEPSVPTQTRRSSRSRSSLSESDAQGQGQGVSNQSDTWGRLPRLRKRLSTSESDTLEKHKSSAPASNLYPIAEKEGEMKNEANSELVTDCKKGKSRAASTSTISKADNSLKKEENVCSRELRSRQKYVAKEDNGSISEEKSKSRISQKEEMKLRSGRKGRGNEKEQTNSSAASIQENENNRKGRNSLGTSSTGTKKEKTARKLKAELLSLRESFSEKEVEEDTYNIGGHSLRKGNYDLKVEVLQSKTPVKDSNVTIGSRIRKQSIQTSAKIDSDMSGESDRTMTRKKKKETESRSLTSSRKKSECYVEMGSAESSYGKVRVHEEDFNESDDWVSYNERSRLNSRPKTSKQTLKQTFEKVNMVNEERKDMQRRSRRLSERR